MSDPAQPPKTAKPNSWSRFCSDKRILAGCDFLIGLWIGVVVVSLAVASLAVGAYFVAVIIHFLYQALEGQKLDFKVELPAWAHNAEVQSAGVTLSVFLVLAVAIVGKDAWRVIFRREQETKEKETKPDTKSVGKTRKH